MMRARHCPPLQPDNDPADACYLGDMPGMEVVPQTFREIPPYDAHWHRRGLIVVIAVILVWSGICWWVFG